MRNKTSLYGAASLGALLAIALGASAQAQETTTVWKGAPQFQNDALTFKVRGRVYIDAVSQEVDFANPATLDTSAQVSRLRTARLGIEGTWNQNWAYKAEFSIVGGSAGGTTQWEDLILEYKPNDMTSIMVGNFKSVSFENISSSRYTTFMERGPFNDVLGAGRVMTAQAKVNGENWTAAAFVHGDSVNSADPTTGTSEQIAFGGRGTWAPINGDTSKLHLGVWARKRDAADQSAFTYAPRNNTNYGTQYVTSGSIGDTDVQIGGELLYIHGPFSLQSEYANIAVERPAGGMDADINTYYVAGSWFVTGEMRNLEVKKGELGRTKILNPTTAGGFGALELAARYDSVDLTEVTQTRGPFNVGLPPVPVTIITPVDRGGEYTAWTLGVNWYPFPYVRFMANYTKSQNDNSRWTNPSSGVVSADLDADVDTLQFRAQFDF